MAKTSVETIDNLKRPKMGKIPGPPAGGDGPTPKQSKGWS